MYFLKPTHQAKMSSQKKFFLFPVLVDYLEIILAFKLKNNLIKNNDCFKLVKEIHTRSTRSLKDFYVAHCETRLGASNFLHRGLLKNKFLDEKIVEKSLNNFHGSHP